MSKHDHLRQGGAFPGGLVNALDDLDARITALEQHAPMLASIKPAYDAAQAMEVQAETEPAEAPVQSLESQQEPEPDAQGGQS